MPDPGGIRPYSWREGVREGVTTGYLPDRLLQVRVIREAGTHVEPKHP